MGMMVVKPNDESHGVCVESITGRHPQAGEIDAYERLLGDAMAGDATLFAHEGASKNVARSSNRACRAVAGEPIRAGNVGSA